MTVTTTLGLDGLVGNAEGVGATDSGGDADGVAAGDPVPPGVPAEMEGVGIAAESSGAHAVSARRNAAATASAQVETEGRGCGM